MKLSDLHPDDVVPVKAQASGLKLSDLKPEEVQPAESPGLLEKIDRYSGASSIRKGLQTLQGGSPEDSYPEMGRRIIQAGKDAFHQYGKPGAPTPGDLINETPAVKGLLDNPEFRDAFSNQPTAIAARVPLSPFLGIKGAKDAIGAVPRMAAEGAMGFMTDPAQLALEGASPLISKGIGKAWEMTPNVVKSGISKGAETLTGVPKDMILNYIDRNPQIKALYEKYGRNTFEAADDLKTNINQRIQDKKGDLSLMIEQATQNVSRRSNIPVQPMLEELNNHKMGLNPNIPEQMSAIRGIDEMIAVLKGIAPEGKMTARDAFDVQKMLQGRAQSAYAQPGDLFTKSPQSAKAAKDAARVTRQFVNKAMPDVAAANDAFAALHDIDDVMNPNLLKPGKSAAGITRAGSNPNSPEAKSLKDLGDWLGHDVLQDAKDMSTHKTFATLPASPFDTTGKALYRVGAGSLVGGGISALNGDSGGGILKGAAVGGLLSSPMALKAAIDSGMFAKRLAVLGMDGIEKLGPKIEPYLNKVGSTTGDILEQAKGFLKDEGGSIGLPPKPGTENVYDLKQAREIKGEPKGLLRDEDAGVVKFGKVEDVPNSKAYKKTIDWAKDRQTLGDFLTAVDRAELDRIRNAITVHNTSTNPTKNDIQLLNDVMEILRKNGNHKTEVFLPKAKNEGVPSLLDRVGDGQTLSEEQIRYLKTVIKEASNAKDEKLASDAMKALDTHYENLPSNPSSKTADVTSLNIERKRGPKTMNGEGGNVIGFLDKEAKKPWNGEDRRVGPRRGAEDGPQITKQDLDDRFAGKNVTALDVPWEGEGKKPRPTKIRTPSDNPEALESLKNRYGEDKKAVKAIERAQDASKGPYVTDENILSIGWAPNFKAEPTGMIGERRIHQPFTNAKADPDPLNWSDNKYGATKKLIQAHKEQGLPLTINTSSDLIGHDDYITAMPKETTVNMYMLSGNDHLNRILFPGNPSNKRLVTAVERLKDAGIKVNRINPTAEEYIKAAGGRAKVRKSLGPDGVDVIMKDFRENK